MEGLQLHVISMHSGEAALLVTLRPIDTKNFQT